MHFWRISNTSLPLRRDQNSRIWAIPFFVAIFDTYLKFNHARGMTLQLAKLFKARQWNRLMAMTCVFVFMACRRNEIVVIRCNSPQFLAGNLFRLSFQTLKCCGGPRRAIFSFVALKWRRFLGEILTIWGSSWEGGVQFLWKSFSIFFIFLPLSAWPVLWQSSRSWMKIIFFLSKIRFRTYIIII